MITLTDRIRATNWDQTEIGSGSIGSLLLELSIASPERTDELFEQIEAVLLPQETVSRLTLPAIPFLIELTEMGRGRARAYELLSNIAACCSAANTREGGVADVSEGCRRAIGAGYLTFLRDLSDRTLVSGTRLDIVHILWRTVQPKLWAKHLRELLRTERDGEFSRDALEYLSDVPADPSR